MAVVKEIAKGAFWVLLFKAVSRGLGLVSIFILARQLTPEDFGLVALAMAVIAVFDLATNFSFDVALIQNQSATRQHYDTVWTMAICFQTVIALLLVSVAFPVASLFDEPDLAYALMALAVVPILEGIQNVKIVDFRKKMMFDKDFKFMMTKQAVGFSVTIPLAFILQNYWALIIGTISGRLAGTIASYLLIPFKPHLRITHWRELFGFSKWLFAYNILIFLRFRATGFIIGKVSGIKSLGIFEVSQEISSIPTTELVAPLNRAILPGLSKINNDLEALGNNYIRIVGVILFLATPAGVGIAATAEPLVYVLLGQKWVDAIPIISILGIVGAINCTETNTSTTCIAIGRPDLATRLYGFYAISLLLLTAWFATKFGAIGAAWAWLIASILNMPIYYTVLLTAINIRFPRFLSIVWRPALSSALMYFGVKWFLSGKPDYSTSIDALPVLFQAVGVGVVIYSASALAFWYAAGRPDGPEQDVLSQIKQRLRSRSE